MIPFRRGRRLRNHAFALALIVVASPLVLVMATNWIETLFGDRTLSRVDGTAAAIAEELSQGSTPDDALREHAGGQDQLVRVLTPEGSVVAHRDEWVGQSWSFKLGDLFYGPDREEALLAWERGRPNLIRRDETQSALATGAAERCDFSSAGNLYICVAAKRVTTPGGGELIVHAQGSSRRALQAIYEARRQLIKLMLFAAALGLGLAWWTRQTLVRPVERLREQVLASATEAVPRARIDIGRRDELGDLADAFNTVLAALAERNKNNEAFLADLAHEFKNPVAAIRACAERLDETKPDDAERLKRLRDVLHGSAVRLDALVTQLLELARAEAGLKDEPRQPVELTALLHGLCAGLQADPRYAHLRMELRTPESPVQIEGVSARLEAALRNILDNAASFAGDGGAVRVSLRQLPEGVVIAITDSGPGISPEVLPRIFERFFTTRREQNGSGLGLSLARAVVEAHGGRIEVESEPGEGTTFSILLPTGNTARQLAA